MPVRIWRAIVLQAVVLLASYGQTGKVITWNGNSVTWNGNNAYWTTVSSPILITWNGLTATWNGVSMSWNSSNTIQSSAVDYVGIRDSSSAASAHKSTYQEVTGMLDSSGAVAHHFPSVLDTLPFADFQGNTRGKGGLTNDAILSSDFVSIHAAHFPSVSDFLPPGDGAVTINCPFNYISWNGSFVTWNGNQAYWGCSPGIAHPVLITETMVFRDKSPLVMSASMVWPEGIVGSDGLLLQNGRARFTTENLTASDVGLSIGGHGVSGFDSVPISGESASPHAAHFPSPLETVPVYDTVVGLKVKLVLVSDTLAVSDAVATASGLHVTGLEVVESSDLPSTIHGNSVSVSDANSSIESTNTGVGRVVLDSLAAMVDLPSLHNAKNVSVNDVLSAIDQAIGVTAANQHYIITASEFSLLLDNGAFKTNAIIPILSSGNVVVYIEQNTIATYQPRAIIVVINK